MSTPMVATREALGDMPNPLGLQGIEFIEYATSRPQAPSTQTDSVKDGSSETMRCGGAASVTLAPWSSTTVIAACAGNDSIRQSHHIASTRNQDNPRIVMADPPAQCPPDASMPDRPPSR